MAVRIPSYRSSRIRIIEFHADTWWSLFFVLDYDVLTCLLSQNIYKFSIANQMQLKNDRLLQNCSGLVLINSYSTELNNHNDNKQIYALRVVEWLTSRSHTATAYCSTSSESNFALSIQTIRLLRRNASLKTHERCNFPFRRARHIPCSLWHVNFLAEVTTELTH